MTLLTVSSVPVVDLGSLEDLGDELIVGDADAAFETVIDDSVDRACVRTAAFDAVACNICLSAGMLG